MESLGLLEPMQAQFNLPSGQKKSLTGFMAINRDKLKALSDEKLSELVKSDELELIYIHLQSMKNFSAMLGMEAGDEGEPQTEPPVKTKTKAKPKVKTDAA